MNIPQGPWYIDDTLTFTVTTHRFDTGALTDADSVPTYRVYKDETGTAILTGSMAKLDDTNTTGFYSEQITLSAANGFEVGKSYSIYVAATVNSVAGGLSGGFKVIASTYPANVTQFGGSNGTFSSGRPEVNATHLAGTAYASADLSAPMKASVNAEADTAMSDYDAPTKSELDFALTSLATAAALATVDSNVDAIKAKTDSLNFGVSGVVNANITHVNETEVSGNGSEGSEWGPAS